MFCSSLAVLIIGPLRDLTACKSQAVEIAGQNIMETQESVKTSVCLSLCTILFRKPGPFSYSPKYEICIASQCEVPAEAA